MHDLIGVIVKVDNEKEAIKEARIIMDERSNLDPGDTPEEWNRIICDWYSLFEEEEDYERCDWLPRCTCAPIYSKNGIQILNDLLDKGDPKDYKDLEMTYPRIINWDGKYIRNDRDFRNIILRQYDIISVSNLWIVPVDIHI